MCVDFKQKLIFPLYIIFIEFALLVRVIQDEQSFTSKTVTVQCAVTQIA